MPSDSYFLHFKSRNIARASSVVRQRKQSLLRNHASDYSAELYDRKEERRARWQNLKMDMQNRDIKTQKMTILFKVSNTTIFGLQGVGDIGSSLSGGQKQRVLLARALYKQPKILALDKATSHLDIDNEHKVNQVLSKLHLTRIMVAHRPETINAAERVVALQDGQVVEVRGVLTSVKDVLVA